MELIPQAALEALGRRLALGAERHGANNWRKGKEDFRVATLNHLQTHLAEYIANGGSEELDAIICNAAFLCQMEKDEPFEGQLSIEE